MNEFRFCLWQEYPRSDLSVSMCYTYMSLLSASCRKHDVVYPDIGHLTDFCLQSYMLSFSTAKLLFPPLSLLHGELLCL